MSDQIEVRLLYPNFGKARGETVLMDAEEATAWFRRRLAEPVDAEAHAERHLLSLSMASETVETAPVTPPPPRGPMPQMKPVNVQP